MISKRSKTILIKTFVLGANHGQYLQALGLSLAIKSISDKFEIYHPFYNNHWLLEIFSAIKDLTLIKYLNFIFYWFKRFDFKPKSFIANTEIYGSDMIWHNNSNLFKFDKYYFRKNKYSRKVISYAPSVGRRNISIEPKQLIDLESFNSISVRDENTFNFVRKYVSVIPQIVCDPVLFLCLEKVKNNFIKSKFKENSKNIISIYGNNLIFKSIMDVNNDFVNQFKVRSLGYFSKYKFFIDLNKQLSDPIDLIKDFSESSLILTTTFHGVITSLLTKKPFLAIGDENLISRLSQYSKYFSNDRILNKDDLIKKNNFIDLEKLMDCKDIDYVQLNKFVEDSYLWLRDNLVD